MLLSSLNYIFQDSFNKILFQQLTHDRSNISLRNAQCYYAAFQFSTERRKVMPPVLFWR